MQLKSVITAIVTPFDLDGKIDYFTFKKIIREQTEQNVSGVVIFGTTGECCTLSHDEKISLLKEAVNAAKGEISIIANVGTNSTLESLLLAKEAKELGADYLLAIVPYYNKPEKEGIIKHFHLLADVGLPMIFYHHPKRTGIELEFETIKAISDHPNIFGIKECSSNLELIRRIKKEIPNLKIYSGNDDELLLQKPCGLDGVISVVAQLFPDPFLKFFDDDYPLDLQNLINVIKCVFKEVNPQGIKAAYKILGYPNMELRLPLVSVRGETYQAIEQEIKLVLELKSQKSMI